MRAEKGRLGVGTQSHGTMSTSTVRYRYYSNYLPNHVRSLRACFDASCLHQLGTQ